METKNVLFVCTANIKRSRSAEVWFSWLNQNRNFSSAGSNRFLCRLYGGKPVTKKMLTAADRIICMEPRNQEEIQKSYGHTYDEKIEVAGIEVGHNFFDIQLLFELTDKIEI